MLLPAGRGQPARGAGAGGAAGLVHAGLQRAPHPHRGAAGAGRQSTADEESAFALDEVSRTLHQVIQLLERMQNGRYVPSTNQNDGQPRAALTETFVASVKNAARPGLKLDGR
jgi:hypothetical protein